MRVLIRYRYTFIVLAVMIPRIAWFFSLHGQMPRPVRDQSLYIIQAGRILEGKGLSFSSEMGWLRYVNLDREEFRESWGESPGYVFGMIPVETPTASMEPGYPLLLAGVFMITGPFTGGVFLLNCIFAILGVFALHALMRENWGEGPAMISAIIWSLYPYYVYYSAYAMTETIHISMLPVILLLTVRAGSRRGYALPAGLASSFLFLVRSTAIFLLPLQLGWLMVKRRWREALLLAAGFAALCLPWMIRNQIQLGRPVLMPTKGALNLWMRNNPEILSFEGIGLPAWVDSGIRRRDLLEYPSMEGQDTELQRSDLLMSRAREFILSNPGLVAYLTFRRGVNFLWPVGMTVGGTVPALAGLFIYLPMLIMAAVEFWRRRRDGKVILIGLVFLLYLAIHSLAHGGVRYRLPVDTVLIMLASIFIHDMFKGRRTVGPPAPGGDS